MRGAFQNRLSARSRALLGTELIDSTDIVNAEFRPCMLLDALDKLYETRNGSRVQVRGK